MRDFAHHFLLGYFLDSDYHLQPRRHYGHRRKTSKDAVLRKDVLSGIAKPKSNIYTPFPPSKKTAILGPDFDGTWKFSAEKQLQH